MPCLVFRDAGCLVFSFQKTQDVWMSGRKRCITSQLQSKVTDICSCQWEGKGISWKRTFDIGVSKNSGIPKWMVYNGTPYWNGWFGGTPIFGNIHIGTVDNHSHPLNDYISKPTGPSGHPPWNETIFPLRINGLAGRWYKFPFGGRWCR